jgi:iron complex transport system substrate-binding protein
MTRKCILLLALLFGLSFCSNQFAYAQALGTDQRAMTDMAGRTVIVPQKIHKVMGMSPVGTILIYTLSPELLAGWNVQLEPGELALIPEPYRSLPVLGGWYGKNNTGNLEVIIQAHPDLILSMGDALGTAIADRLQQQTHIPVFVLDGSLKKLPDTYIAAGELLGNPQRAQLLAAECRRTLDEISSKVATIPPEKRRRVYYAEGPTGLETEPGGSMHSEALIFAGAENVAAVPGQQGIGHTPVSMEQVLTWNPDVIVSGYDYISAPGEFYRKVWTDAAWKYVAAVRNGQVVEAPQYPFNWIDRPPSVNRVIGIKWIANLLYPEIFHYNIGEETRRFYATFYHIKLSDAQLNQVLITALPRTVAATK